MHDKALLHSYVLTHVCRASFLSLRSAFFFRARHSLCRETRDPATRETRIMYDARATMHPVVAPLLTERRNRDSNSSYG